VGTEHRFCSPWIRLNRDVAIKVSNAQFTERFTREARTIASLNHTNICHLCDVVAKTRYFK
jgi:serine/threonine protein kinase